MYSALKLHNVLQHRTNDSSTDGVIKCEQRLLFVALAFIQPLTTYLTYLYKSEHTYRTIRLYFHVGEKLFENEKNNFEFDFEAKHF